MIINRIKQIVENESITLSKLEQKIGSSRGVLSRSYKNKTDIQSKWVTLIVENYPVYDSEWLLTGKGEMLRENMLNKTNVGSIEGNHNNINSTLNNSNISTNNRSIDTISQKELTNKKPIATPVNDMQGIPLIPISAMAGWGTSEQTVLEYECERFVIPVFKEAEFLIGVRGSSMYPNYNSGDIVACKKISLDKIFFQWNKVYVLDTVQGVMIKRVKKSTLDNNIICFSDNSSYDPFELNLSDIYSIAIVVGVVRLE